MLVARRKVAPSVRLMESPALQFSNLGTWYGRSELRQQVTEAKNGPLELSREKGKDKVSGGKKRGRDSELLRGRASVLKVFIWRSWEDPNRTFVSFPGMSFQGQGLY